MLSSRPKILSFILIAVMLAAALGGLLLSTDTAEAAPIEFSSSALPASGTLMQASSTWAATRDASTGSVLSQTVYMAQASIQAGYDPIIARSLFWFDLSVSNSFTLNGVSLSLTPRGVWDSVGSTKLLFLIPSGSVGTTLDGNDYSRTLYTGGVACEIPLSSLTDGVTSSFALTAAGKTYINSIQDRSAVPLYMVVSSDYNNSPPPAGGNVGADFEGYSTVKLVYNFEGPTTYVWDGGGSTNLASDRYNWDKNIAPQPGSDVRYDATSVKACTWDLATEVYSFAIATGYTGTVSLSSALTVGAGGIAQTSGTLTGNGKAIYNAGDLTKTGGTITGVYWYATGDGSIWSINTQMVTPALHVDADITLKGAQYYLTALLDVSTGNSLTLDGIVLRLDTITSAKFINDGEITGSGTLWIVQYSGTNVVDLGMISCSIDLANPSDGAGSAILKLGGPLGASSIIVRSSHATDTITLDLNGYSTSASSITIGTRGVLTNTGAAAACTVSGTFIQNGVGSTVSGPIALSCGSLAISSGTFNQGAANVVIGTSGFSFSGGTLIGENGYRCICSGNVAKTGGTYNAANLHITMVGTTSITWDGAYTARLGSLWFDGDVTVSSGLVTQGLKGISGSLSGSTVQVYYIDGIAPADAPVTIHNVVYAKSTGATNNFDPLNYHFDDLRFEHINLGEGATRYIYIRQPFSGNIQSTAIAGVSAMNVRIVMETDLYLDSITIRGGSLTLRAVLDANGHNLTSTGITFSIGGSILFGPHVTNYGNLDASAGTLDAGTSHYIQAGNGIITVGPSQSLYDLTVNSGVTATLGSDVEVTHYAVIYGSVVRGDYILTLAHIINSYPQLTLDKFDNYLYRINVVPGAQLTMLEYPSWLTWNPHQLTLSGKAVQAGTFNVRIMAEYPGAQQEYQNYTVTVSGLPPTPGWSGGQPLTDYGSIMLYIVVGAAIAFILLVFAFMRRR